MSCPSISPALAPVPVLVLATALASSRPASQHPPVPDDLLLPVQYPIPVPLAVPGQDHDPYPTPLTTSPPTSFSHHSNSAWFCLGSALVVFGIQAIGVIEHGVGRRFLPTDPACNSRALSGRPRNDAEASGCGSATRRCPPQGGDRGRWSKMLLRLQHLRETCL